MGNCRRGKPDGPLRTPRLLSKLDFVRGRAAENLGGLFVAGTLEAPFFFARNSRLRGVSGASDDPPSYLPHFA